VALLPPNFSNIRLRQSKHMIRNIRIAIAYNSGMKLNDIAKLYGLNSGEHVRQIHENILTRVLTGLHRYIPDCTRKRNRIVENTELLMAYLEYVIKRKDIAYD
jgi:hypothetical protein